jgi:hypothetical protein
MRPLRTCPPFPLAFPPFDFCTTQKRFCGFSSLACGLLTPLGRSFCGGFAAEGNGPRMARIASNRVWPTPSVPHPVAQLPAKKSGTLLRRGCGDGFRFGLWSKLPASVIQRWQRRPRSLITNVGEVCRPRGPFGANPIHPVGRPHECGHYKRAAQRRFNSNRRGARECFSVKRLAHQHRVGRKRLPTR